MEAALQQNKVKTRNKGSEKTKLWKPEIISHKLNKAHLNCKNQSPRKVSRFDLLLINAFSSCLKGFTLIIVLSVVGACIRILGWVFCHLPNGNCFNHYHKYIYIYNIYILIKNSFPLKDESVPSCARRPAGRLTDGPVKAQDNSVPGIHPSWHQFECRGGHVTQLHFSWGTRTFW